jgi:hypothetical protein
VRRFTLGATLAVTVLTLVPNRTTSTVTTSPALDALHSAGDITNRIGFGATAQLVLTERFAVNIRLVQRKLGYKANSDIYEGTDNPITTPDERRHTVRSEDTRSKLYDLPVTLRYFTKDRHDPGPRVFMEFGGVVRRPSNIKTTVDTTVGTAATVRDTTPATPANRNVVGAVAGLGVQLIDPVGIRVIPEVRYTRWFGETFKKDAVTTRRDQIEAVLTISF